MRYSMVSLVSDSKHADLLSSSIQPEEVSTKTVPSNERVSYGKLLCYPRFTFAALARAFQGFNFTHQEPLLATRLIEKNLTVM